VSRGQEAVNCGRAVDEVVPASDLVIIASTSPASDHGVANNFEDPTIFYFADRHGWSLAADYQEPVLVESEIRQGARWLITSQPLLDEHPDLAGLLATSARLESVGAYGTGTECLIYRLGSS